MPCAAMATAVAGNGELPPAAAMAVEAPGVVSCVSTIEERLAALVALAGAGARLWVSDGASGRVVASPGLVALVDLRPEEPLAAALHPEDAAAFSDGLSDAARTPAAITVVDRKYRLRLPAADAAGWPYGGSWRWVRDSAVPYFVGGGGGGGSDCRLGGFVGWVTDISAEAFAYEALQAFSGFWPVVALSKCQLPEGGVIWCSNGGFGSSMSSEKARWYDRVHPHDLFEVQQQIALANEHVAQYAAASAGGSQGSTAGQQAPDGQLRPQVQVPSGASSASAMDLRHAAAKSARDEGRTGMARPLKMLKRVSSRVRDPETGEYERYLSEWAVDPRNAVLYCLSLNWAKESALQRELLALESRLKIALRGCNGSLYDFSTADDELYVSSELLKMYGLPPDHKFPAGAQAGLDHLRSFHHKDDVGAITKQWRETDGRQEMSVCGEMRIFRADTGEMRWIRNVAVAFPLTAEAMRRMDAESDGMGQSRRPPYSRVTGIMFDVTEEKKAAAALEQAREAAEAASKAKSFFIANTSHEIRTPLNAVLGCGALLQHTPLTPEQEAYVKAIQSSGEALMAIINDILDFTKIEVGKMVLEVAPFSLRDTLQASLETVRFQAAAKGLELTCELDSRVPEAVLGDCTRLRQVLINLLSNAVKFTKTGFVRLEAAVLEESVDWASVALVPGEEAQAAVKGLRRPPRRSDEREERAEMVARAKEAESAAAAEAAREGTAAAAAAAAPSSGAGHQGHHGSQHARESSGPAGTLKQPLRGELGRAAGGSKPGMPFRKGAPKILLPGAEVAPEPVLVRLAVVDSGIGMPKDRRHLLFRAFSQADTSTTRIYGGSGLGLAICSRLVQLMKGRIGYEERPGGGSQFFCVIPLTPTNEDRAAFADPSATVLPSPMPLLHKGGPRLSSFSDPETPLPSSAPNGSWPSPTQASTLMVPSSFKQIVAGSGGGSVEAAAVMAAEAVAAAAPSNIAAAACLMPGNAANVRADIAHGALPVPGGADRLPLDPRVARSGQSGVGGCRDKSADARDSGLAGAAGLPRGMTLPPGCEHLPGISRLLVVEDNAVNQRVLCRMLQHLGYNVFDVVSNGLDAVAQIAGQHYEVVLLDLWMPVLDGIGASRIITRDYAVDRRPVIVAVTAAASVEDRDNCLDAGMDFFLTKPIRMDLLSKVLAQSYSLYTQRRSTA